MRIVSNGVQPYIVQTGVDTDGETQEEVTTFRMKLDVSEWLVDKSVMGSCSAARMDARPVIHASPQGWMIVALLSGSRDGWLDNRATDWPFMGLRHMGAGR
ncbi:hypothetical protein DPX16_9588 [Anabarilius grahami]|uniref:Uncharacterized protein n=1 Tax=Anabarilius grahami TaxID=495550 RepID=A0A3N0Z7F0_ANAGA|nr:hypothetical protein DPX16_9588 [Anabarilius grahami]